MNCRVAQNEIMPFMPYARHAPWSPKNFAASTVEDADIRIMNRVLVMFSFNLFVMINIEPDHEIREKM